MEETDQKNKGEKGTRVGSTRKTEKKKEEGKGGKETREIQRNMGALCLKVRRTRTGSPRLTILTSNATQIIPFCSCSRSHAPATRAPSIVQCPDGCSLHPSFPNPTPCTRTQRRTCVAPLCKNERDGGNEETTLQNQGGGPQWYLPLLLGMDEHDTPEVSLLRIDAGFQPTKRDENTFWYESYKLTYCPCTAAFHGLCKGRKDLSRLDACPRI